MHWETKKFVFHLLHYNIRFMAVVWNQARNISEIYLYLSQCRIHVCPS